MYNWVIYMKTHIERKESDEQLLSSCLQKQKIKPTWRELNVPSIFSLYKQSMELR